MGISNVNFITEVLYIIRITEKSGSNNEINILTKINQKTNISKTKAKMLFDKYTDKYWEVERFADNSTKVRLKGRFKAYLHEDDDIGGK